MKRSTARTGLSAVAALAASFTALPSQAQNFYEKGEVSVAIERAFGIHYVQDDYDGPGPVDFERSGTTVGLGWYGARSVLHWSRAAVDGFVVDRLSLGGSVGFFTQTGDGDTDGFLISPRVGYAIPLSNVFTFWPRGGLTFVKAGEASLFALSAEAMFVVNPKPSWGILFGPTLDIGFVGEDGDDTDWSQLALGFPTVGLMGTF